MSASCREFHGLVLVMYLLDFISSSTKGISNSLILLHCEMCLKINMQHESQMRPFYIQCFLARPIHDKDEHSRNDDWECF